MFKKKNKKIPHNSPRNVCLQPITVMHPASTHRINNISPPAVAATTSNAIHETFMRLL